MISERIVKLLARQLELSPTEIGADTHIVNDLGADSLDVVELIISVEEEFNILIPEEQAKDLFTVRQIVEYINKIKI